MLYIKIINFLVFQLGWFIEILFHSTYAALIGICLALLNLAMAKEALLKNLMVSIIIAGLGVLNDFCLMQLNIITFPLQENAIIPFWLVALWILFVSTFAVSLRWLQNQNILICAILGAIGGALSYYAGSKFNVIAYNYTGLPQLVFHAINWFFLFPMLFRSYFKILKLL